MNSLDKMEDYDRLAKLDTEYFKKKLTLIVRDADSYTTQEMALSLRRLADVAEPCELAKLCEKQAQEIAEKDRKLAEQQAYILKLGNTQYENFTGSADADTFAELQSLITQAEQRGIKQGEYNKQLEYSQMEPEAWMSNTGKDPSYPLMRIPPVPTLYGTVECASCHRDVVLTEPFDGVDIVCNACLLAPAPLKEGG